MKYGIAPYRYYHICNFLDKVKMLMDNDINGQENKGGIVPDATTVLLDGESEDKAAEEKQSGVRAESILNTEKH